MYIRYTSALSRYKPKHKMLLLWVTFLHKRKVLSEHLIIYHTIILEQTKHHQQSTLK